MKKRALKTIVAIALIAGLIVPAGSGNAAAKTKKKISISKTMNVNVTNFKQLKLKNVTKKQAKNIKWKSSKSSVVKVYKDGMVYGVKKGSAKVTATYKKKKYTCKVTVKQGTSGWAYMLEPDFDPYKSNYKYNIKWHFSDGYFAKNASEYEKNLAEFSTLLSCASGTSAKANELLSVAGFDEMEVNDDYNKEPGKNTLGIGFATKKIKANGKEYTLIATVIRSNGYGAEWSSNLDAGTTGDHKGFTEAKEKLITALQAYIRKKDITGDVKFFFAGHSRGGTVNNLAEAEIADNPDLLSGVSYEREDIYGYNMSALSAVDISDGKNVKDNYKFIHNIFMVYDLVPELMPPEYKFGRYGTDVKIEPTEAQTAKSLALLKKTYPPKEDEDGETEKTLYEIYTDCQPEENAEAILCHFIDTLIKLFPTRADYEAGLKEELEKLFVSGFSMDVIMGLLNTPFGEEFAETYNEVAGYDMAVMELMNFNAIIIQHYTEVIYAFLQYA
ncbi:MAG: Ig-like domain-containing protein [Eubacterium sp.]|nr:Ig-like domain-containing protein [Eubacterium sp.]